MVNVIIYLKKEHKAKELVLYLLSEKLIASASIDENNLVYKMSKGKLSEHLNTVITSQSKSLLFNDIVKAVESYIGEEIPINSIPIIASNTIFDKTIRASTLAI